MAKDMTSLEKLLFISSFLWTLHWGTRVVFLILDTVLVSNAVKLLPIGF